MSSVVDVIRNYAAVPVPLLIVAATAASYGVGLLFGVPPLVPVLNTLAAFPFMVASLRRGQLGGAIARMLVWAATMGAVATLLGYWRTSETERLFIHAAAYRREMFAWILTGVGAESDPRQFIATHAAHAGIFSALSLVSGSVLSMPMGAVLMNYMGHYVGALAAASRQPLTAVVLGWNPWSIVRIVSFVTLGTVLSGPILARVARFPFRLRACVPVIGYAAAGLVLDILLKWLLAPTWQRLLARAAGW